MDRFVNAATVRSVVPFGKAIRELPRLHKIYGRANWRKRKGIARIRFENGSIRLAEIHSYEACAYFPLTETTREARRPLAPPP